MLREESGSKHFLELENGILQPVTPVGEFTIRRLRLNRAPLIAHRVHKRRTEETRRLLNRYRELIHILEQLFAYQSRILEDQQALLEEQRMLLSQLLDDKRE